jgi:hypothetical protein
MKTRRAARERRTLRLALLHGLLAIAFFASVILLQLPP